MPRDKIILGFILVTIIAFLFIGFLPLKNEVLRSSSILVASALNVLFWLYFIFVAPKK